MIVKVLVNGKEYGVDVYENNVDGEVQVNDTHHLDKEIEVKRDTIFGTLDQMITINIPYDEIRQTIIDDIANEVVGDLRAQGTGSTYNRSHAFDKAHDRMEEAIYDIADKADQIMTEKYTDESNLTIIEGDDNVKYEPQCKHACDDCAGYETTDECNHGCDDCGHFDGGNCINIASNYYGCYGGIAAADCHEWDNGE